MNFNENQKKLRKRLIEILYNSHSSHIGSCLTAIDLIDLVYSIKKKEERFVLSNGHSALALYVVLEKNGYIKDIESEHLNIHPDRNTNIGIEVSTGSLGLGLPIATGMALADRNKLVYCLISDGECAEGSIWESLRIIYEQRIVNLKIILNANGWGAYDPISLYNLSERFKGFGFNVVKVYDHDLNKIKNSLIDNNLDIIFAMTDSDQFPFLRGLDAHYYVMNEKDFLLAMEILK
jgi:transketolase